MEAKYAENGRQGIAALQNTPGINIVLMDVMMPEMDGYEQCKQFAAPHSASPANDCSDCAMKGDRENVSKLGRLITLPNPLHGTVACQAACLALSIIGRKKFGNGSQGRM